ncbi:RNA-directed DNA polymerase, eukaryota [Tanacetum coccineum]
MIRGVWLKTGNDLLIVLVYSPQELNEKKMLWDYLTHVINNWKGKVIIMGDFNEVRYKSERFGSMFNIKGANVFSTFIANAGLEEVPLGGSSFTWCHKSATKMSKLDRLSEYHNTWIEAPVDASNAMINMMKKLKYLKQTIREWNKDNMISLKNRKVKLKDDLKAVDAIIDKGKGNEEIVNKRMEFFKSIQDIDKLQSLEMAQKAKIKWSIEGGENSSFYHGVLNKKRSQLNIRGIIVEGIWTDSPQMVKKELFQHFKRRFDKPDSWSLKFLKRAVWDCGIDKSPGPDGFTFCFYRRFWKVIENDVFKAVKHFFTYGDIPKGCNSSFIALIPKIPDANVVKDFRPISLIGSLYKIIAKILANRLVVVLGDIVNEVQSAFIADRQILDGPFILNEVLQWCKSKKKQSLIFKVDFEKAYDSVRWDFLDDVLKKFGFGDKWCNWIQSCLRSSRGSKVGGSMHRVQAWSEVVDQVHARLSKWKMKTLSIGGRLESIRSHFFNGHDLNSKKISWVKWKNVLASKEKGGLGVSSLYALNRGLMFKWVWRFLTQSTSLWARVIKAIRGDDGKLEKQVKSVFPSYWMDIVHELNVLKKQVLYPRMYALETCKSVKVGTKLAHSSLDFSFRRRPRGGVEQEQYGALSGQVNDVTLVPLSDKWKWSLENSGDFSVASVRKMIDDKMLPDVTTKTRWIKSVPIKVNVHA